MENENAELIKNTEGKEEENGGKKIKRANVSLSVFSFGPYHFPTFSVQVSFFHLHPVPW